MSIRRVQHADLKRRLDTLANSLLPSDDALGSYTDKQKDQIHAYIVLAHAEIEEYLESLARYVTDLARRDSKPPQCSRLISHLIIHKSASRNETPDAITQEMIEGAVAYSEAILKGNNGIKADNLFRMFMPLGLTHNDFDPILMQELNTFGELRGGIAHTAARLRTGTSPSMERKRVESILEGISHLSEKVRMLKSS
jgi:hypothetical protein